MNVSAPFITRPIATSLLAFATVLGGWLGYFWLPVSSLPQVDFPTIQVSTQLPGANPQTMSTLVTASLEREFGQIPALTTMTSTSSYGLSQITLQFNLGRDIDAAAQDVQSAINAAGSTLPRNLPYPPTYSKVNPADAAIVTLALTSDIVSMRDLSDLADTLIAQRLSTVTGVGHVSVEGGIRPAVRIQADVARLASYGLSISDLNSAITSANVAGPKGSLDGTTQSYTIAANDQIASAEAYREIVVAYRNSAPVRLKDVAEVSEGLENARVGGWYQGTPAVIIDVQRQPGANVIETVDRLKAELPRIERALPTSVKLTTGARPHRHHPRLDPRRAVHAGAQRGAGRHGGAGLPALRARHHHRRRGAAGVADRHLRGDVVLRLQSRQPVADGADHRHRLRRRRCHRHDREHRAPPREGRQAAARRARRRARDRLHGDLADAVADRRVHPATVHDRPRRAHVPRVRADADHRRRRLGHRVADADADDGAKLLRHQPADASNWVSRAFNWRIDAVIEGYRRSLEWVLRHQPATLVVTALTLRHHGLALHHRAEGLPAGAGHRPHHRRARGRAAGLVHRAEPRAGRGDRGGAQGSGRRGRRLRRRRRAAQPDAQRLAPQDHPEAARRARCARRRRRRPAGASRGRRIPGVTVYFQPVQDVQIATRTSRAQYQYTLVSTDAAEVAEWSTRLAAELAQSPSLSEVNLETMDTGLRTRIEVDREVAGRLGVTVQAVSDALNDAFGQRQVSTIYAQANQYRVVLEAMPQYRSDPSRLTRLYIPSTNGAQVPLTAIAKITYTTAPLAVSHQDQFPAETISFNLVPGAALSDAVVDHQRRRGQDRHADVGDRQLLRRRQRVLKSLCAASRG